MNATMMNEGDIYSEKRHFSSVLRGPAAEWYADNITDEHDWQHIRTHFRTRFSDYRDKYRYRVTAENSVRGNEEIICWLVSKLESYFYQQISNVV